ncbi:hypothetical protein ACFX2K_029319 [Malus domestica]
MRRRFRIIRVGWDVTLNLGTGRNGPVLTACLHHAKTQVARTRASVDFAKQLACLAPRHYIVQFEHSGGSTGWTADMLAVNRTGRITCWAPKEASLDLYSQ